MRWLGFCFLLYLATTLVSAEPDQRSLSPAAESLSIADTAGKTWTPADWKEKTVVLVFVGLECPVANAYVPEIKAQQATFADAGFLWLGVHSDVGVTGEAAQKHAAEYHLQLPLLLDGEQRLAAAVEAKRIGQVVVLRNNNVVYRGRIDDRFSTAGKRRDEPSTHELHDVLTALRDGKTPQVADTPAYGCPIPVAKATK